jgi:hypothetical protein
MAEELKIGDTVRLNEDFDDLKKGIEMTIIDIRNMAGERRACFRPVITLPPQIRNTAPIVERHAPIWIPISKLEKVLTPAS